MVSHNPCDPSDLNTKHKVEVTFKQTTNTLFHNFGVVHKSIKLTNSPKQVSQTMQERLTIKVLNLHQHDTRVEHMEDDPKP